MADLSVYPRLAYFEMVGLPIPEKDFPNTYAYLNRLGNMPCVSDSSSFGDKITAFFFSYLPWLPVTFGNLKAGKTQERYDGGQVIERSVCRGLVYWGLTTTTHSSPQQQSGSYRGNDFDDKMPVSLEEETGAPGGNHDFGHSQLTHLYLRKGEPPPEYRHFTQAF